MGRADQHADVSPVLLRLATWLDEMQGDLRDAPLHAARTSQTGVRSTTVGRPAPCPLVPLDEWIDLTDEVIDVVDRAASGMLPAAKRRQGAAACCRWLADISECIADCDDPEQVVEDIKTLELSLYRRWNREVPKGYASNWLDASQVTERAAREGHKVSANRVRKWKQRRLIRHRRFADSQCYWWPDVQERLK
ncbi:hypothetical protein [Corynebacterium ulceribovis]|uniref:hypothetical protein n=1 Tax=Corynebacterium ulceribovis TaxID=487732 RepID=UPI0003733FF7|nr:hypothetical protein [Corynebacterium ulceribovis]